MAGYQKSGLALLLVFSVVGGLLALLFAPFIDFTAARADVAAIRPQPVRRAVSHLPPRPALAPESIRTAVLAGHDIMRDSRKTAPEIAGNSLQCASCHFQGGITEGGRNGGISLVGVAAVYPQADRGGTGVLDLAGRINRCIVENLAGRVLPPESPQMKSLLAYLQWISSGVPVYADVPWLKPDALAGEAPPDPTAGAGEFARLCSLCHGRDGEGTMIAPATWGPSSFTTASGLARPERLAAFIHQNMPRQNPQLSAGQALNVAAFIAAQPRPDPIRP